MPAPSIGLRPNQFTLAQVNTITIFGENLTTEFENNNMGGTAFGHLLNWTIQSKLVSEEGRKLVIQATPTLGAVDPDHPTPDSFQGGAALVFEGSGTLSVTITNGGDSTTQVYGVNYDQP